MGGQNVMVERALDLLRSDDSLTVEHLAFNFNRRWQQHRRASASKIFELFRVIARLFRMRIAGRIDCLIFPFGGPHPAPLVRDLALLPLCHLACPNVVLHVHAGGIADVLGHYPRFVQLALRTVYGRCRWAVVLTDFSRVDADCLGIENIVVVPNSLPDTYQVQEEGRAEDGAIHLLYVGHLCPVKGTLDLLRALARLLPHHPKTHLTLVGEPLPPLSLDQLENLISDLGLKDAVSATGVLVADDKWDSFRRADVFVFPSVAPESFPLVLLEAMMWGLPIVATDWRSHAEILGHPPGGICFEPTLDLAGAIETALGDAFARREEWSEWSASNRRRYLSLDKTARGALVSFVKRFTHDR